MANSLNPIGKAMERVPVGRTKFFELLRTGEIKSVKIGSRRFVSDAAIDEFITQLQTAGSDAA